MMNSRSQSSRRHFGTREYSWRSVLLFWTLAGTLPSSAQAVYGSLFGTVTDKSGAVVANATITVTDISKGTVVTVTSNDSGLYRVQHLIPDAYKIEAEATGYSKSVVASVSVFADTRRRSTSSFLWAQSPTPLRWRAARSCWKPTAPKSAPSWTSGQSRICPTSIATSPPLSS